MVILSPFCSAGHAVKTDVGEAEQIEMLRRRVRQRRSTTIEFHSLPRRMHGRTDGRTDRPAAGCVEWEPIFLPSGHFHRRFWIPRMFPVGAPRLHIG